HGSGGRHDLASFPTRRSSDLRRQEVAQEAEFYGAMDGASKFVRGDAIAGLLIMVINVLGGLIVGLAQHQLSVGEAAHVYTVLTRSEEHTSELQSRFDLVCRLL